MSALDSLLEKVRRVQARIAEVEAVAASFPGDYAVLGNLSSLKRDAEKLERQWEEESIRAQLEVCRYRIAPQFVENYAVRNVGQSLHESASGDDMTKPQKNEDTKGERTPAETDRIAAKTLKNLLNTPPKPFTKPAKGKK